MSKVPVLVTGGAGHVGSYAVPVFVDTGWPVAVIGISSIAHFRPTGGAYDHGRLALVDGWRGVGREAGFIVNRPDHAGCRIPDDVYD
jgi:nucleoside-diphosphate-sugar epimerase